MTGSVSGRAPGIFSATHRWTSVGIFALVFLAAFEALAVTTVMPLASAELDGAAFYALTFSSPLATGIIGMVIAGNWADRNGAKAPLYVTTVLFAVGLVIAGTATSMGMLIVGRLVHGLGGGAMIVPMYVLVARLYPTALRPRVFAGIAAAWSLPALVGPAAAGFVAELFGWRWAFLGVLLLVAPALAMIALPLHRHATLLVPDLPHPPWSVRRILWSALVAVAVLTLNLSTEAEPAIRWPLAVVALAVTLFALRPLVPPGTLRSARGLPTTLLLRLLLGAAFFGTEVYVPYLLVRDYDWSVGAAGLALSGAGVAWAVASWAQARLGPRVSSTLVIRLGATVLVLSLAVLVAVAAGHIGAAPVIPAWILAAAGAGLVYPRLTTLTLDMSDPSEQGFNSSALAIGDSAGTALTLAIAALITTVTIGFGGIFAFAALLGILILLLSARINVRR